MIILANRGSTNSYPIVFFYFCSQLIVFFLQVVHNTIAADLEDINKKVKDTSMALRQERVRLLQVIVLFISFNSQLKF